MDEDDDADSRVVLGVLDGTTPASKWADAVRGGDVLVLAVEGDVNELAGRFARDVREEGGDLIQFRDFLIVTPEGVAIDRDRLT
jgi:SepF-like predicted cell division protein (DUF552 family)